jgi:hypothetical protein
VERAGSGRRGSSEGRIAGRFRHGAPAGIEKTGIFHSRIKPIQKREDDNVLVEVDMVRKAQKDGIPLPEDITKWLQAH